MSAQSQPSSQALPLKFFAREFARSAYDGGVYGIKEIAPMIGLPASDHVEPEHVEEVVAFGLAFTTFKAAMVDSVAPEAPMRKTAVVLQRTASLDHRTNSEGLSHCANGLFIHPGMMVGNVKKYDERYHRSNIQDPVKFSDAMQAALVNAAVSEGVPVILPMDSMDDDRMRHLLYRLNANGYDIVHRTVLPELAPAVKTDPNALEAVIS